MNDQQHSHRAHDNFDRTFSCPLTWCSGDWSQHGGEGQAPERWLHVGQTHVLPTADLEYGVGFATAMQEGAESPRWVVSVAVNEPTSPTSEVARVLRETAAALEALIAGGVQ